MLRQKLLHGLVRLVAPDIAAQMRRGKVGDYNPDADAASVSHIEIDDRGADTTIFVFSGLAALYAGLPSFEFRNMLRKHGEDFNLAFFRDARRSCYHVAPDGSPTGLAFYEAEIRRVQEKLGSTRNIGLGVSVGGSAAIYFGARCGFDRALAFSPAYPLREYCNWRSRLIAFLDLSRLLRSPTAYGELLLVTVAAGISYRRMCKAVGRENTWKVLETHQATNPRPQVTVYYGQHCRPDRQQALAMEGLNDVTLAPLDTPLHNTAGFLKQQGRLAESILEAASPTAI